MTTLSSYLKKNISNDNSFKDKLEFNNWLFEIGYNISSLRKEKQMSQKDFGQKLGVSQAMISKLELGQNMTCDTLWKISIQLGIDLEIFGASISGEKLKVESLLRDEGIKVSDVILDSDRFYSAVSLSNPTYCF